MARGALGGAPPVPGSRELGGLPPAPLPPAEASRALREVPAAPPAPPPEGRGAGAVAAAGDRTRNGGYPGAEPEPTVPACNGYSVPRPAIAALVPLQAEARNPLQAEALPTAVPGALPQALPVAETAVPQAHVESNFLRQVSPLFEVAPERPPAVEPPPGEDPVPAGDPLPSKGRSSGSKVERAKAAEAAEKPPGEEVLPLAHDLFEERIFVPERLLAASSLDRHRFAQRPLAEGLGSLGATVVRRKGDLLFGIGDILYGSTYLLTVGDGNTVLLAARKCAASATKSLSPCYVITASDTDITRESEHYIGRLEGNLLCNRYMLFGRGRTPKITTFQGYADDEEELQEELAAFRMHKPTSEPRSLEVAIPQVDARGVRQEVRPRSPRKEGLVTAWDRPSNGESAKAFHRLINTSPVWDEQRKVFSMDFKGRVKKGSKKNFQLAPADSDFKPVTDPSQTTHRLQMQFGKWDDNNFMLDAAFPLSPLQAFAIALSTFDKRVAEGLHMN